MSNLMPKLEWTIAQSDEEWARLQPPPLPGGEPSDHPLRFLKRYWSVAALCLLLVGAGEWLWHTEQVRAHQAEIEATAAAQSELGVVDLAQGGARSYRSLYTPLQTASPYEHLDTTVQSVEFYGDRAVAHVITSVQRGAPPQRQTQFYQHTATGWLQMAPDAALWGPERSLTTPYFLYHFRQNDAQAVIAVAPQMDALYATLWHNFGLPIIATPDKLVIEVSVTQSPGLASPGFAASNRFVVPSPALYSAPVGLTDVQLLEQSLALPLLDHVLAQARGHHAIGAAWQPMLHGLGLWQVWDLDLPLAAWREDIVQWLYVDLPTLAPGQSFVLPDRYPELCADHKLWLSSPALLNIPLMCARPEGEEQSFPLWRLRDPPTRLDRLVVPLRPDQYREKMDPLHRTVTHPGQTVALATLVEYAVTTYGRDRLPLLVADLGQYDSWETLIPAVYGVSAVEFEAGWQVYLAAHYGVNEAVAGSG